VATRRELEVRQDKQSAKSEGGRQLELEVEVEVEAELNWSAAYKWP